MLVHYEKRIVLPFGCLIISLLGLPLGLLGGPGKRAIGVPIGLFFFMFYYILFTLSTSISESGLLPVEIAMWIPNGIFLVLTLYCLHRMTHEQPFIPDKFKSKYSEFSDHYLKPTVRRLSDSFGFRNKTTIETNETVTEEDSPKYKQAGAIHANAFSRVYHFPECEFYNCKYCTMTFRNAEIATKSGFQPCKFCKNLNKEEHDSDNDE